MLSSHTLSRTAVVFATFATVLFQMAAVSRADDPDETANLKEKTAKLEAKTELLDERLKAAEKQTLDLNKEVAAIKKLLEPEKSEYPVAKDKYPFLVHVRDCHGAAGVWFDIYVDRTAIVVVAGNDFGKPSREILNRQLNKTESFNWIQYYSTFPVQQLQNDYTNPKIADGLQRSFTFKIGQQEKHVSVSNVHVDTLVQLTRRIDGLLPDDMKINPPLNKGNSKK